MNFDRITINIDSTGTFDLGDLESTSSGIVGSGPISLHASFKNFLEQSEIAQDCLSSPDMAEKHYANVCNALRRHLSADGFDADVLACRGLKVRLTPCSRIAAEALNNYGQAEVCRDFLHLAVRVGNIILDPAHLRCGKEYMASNNALYMQFKTKWNEIKVLGAARNTDANSFIGLIRRLVAATRMGNPHMVAVAGEFNPADYAFDPATASSLVDGFGEGSRFKRERRLRPSAKQ